MQWVVEVNLVFRAFSICEMVTFSSLSGEISSLSNLGCGDLPLWLMLVELLELEGGVLILGGTGADGYLPSLLDIAPWTRWLRELSVNSEF